MTSIPELNEYHRKSIDSVSLIGTDDNNYELKKTLFEKDVTCKIPKNMNDNELKIRLETIPPYEKLVNNYKDIEAPRNLKKKYKNMKTKSKRKPSGFCKPTEISNELCSFMNKPKGSLVARTEATLFITKYIRDNNYLQDCLENLIDLKRQHRQHKLKIFIKDIIYEIIEKININESTNILSLRLDLSKIHENQNFEQDQRNTPGAPRNIDNTFDNNFNFNYNYSPDSIKETNLS